MGEDGFCVQIHFTKKSLMFLLEKKSLRLTSVASFRLAKLQKSIKTRLKYNENRFLSDAAQAQQFNVSVFSKVWYKNAFFPLGFLNSRLLLNFNVHVDRFIRSTKSKISFLHH
jgi:hypothetical protein